MEKRNKIRDWQLERDVLKDKLDLCEDKLVSLKQDPMPDDFKPSKERLAAAKVRDNGLNTHFCVNFRMV